MNVLSLVFFGLLHCGCRRRLNYLVGFFVVLRGGRFDGGLDDRANGRTHGRANGRTDRWTNGRAHGRANGRANGWTDSRWTDRWTDGRGDRGFDGRADGWTDGRGDRGFDGRADWGFGGFDFLHRGHILLHHVLVGFICESGRLPFENTRVSS